MKRINHYAPLYKTVLFACAAELLRFAKTSFIFGSQSAFFSLNQCVSPLVYPFGNAASTIFFFLVRTGITFMFAPTTLLVYHIPSFLGAFAFGSPQKDSVRYRIVLFSFFALSIFLFVIHPIGREAFGYCALWIIPICALFFRLSIFSRALISTFVTHATGSLITLYTTNMLTPVQWLGIIPIALVERIVFALGIVMCYHIAHALQSIVLVRHQKTSLNTHN